MTFLRDQEPQIDLLYYESIAETLAKLVRSTPQTPITVGVQANAVRFHLIHFAICVLVRKSAFLDYRMLPKRRHPMARALSFAQWRQAEQLKFDAELRALKRGVQRMLLKRRWQPWLRRWLALPTLVIASLAMAAMLLTSDPGVRRGDQSLVAAHSSAVAGGVSARAIATDGNTLKLAGERIRLHGIDAPEAQHRCDGGWPAGEEAERALATRPTSIGIDGRLRSESGGRHRPALI
ncbi:MAG: hypothetical protein KIT25_03755 [Enhydrobacter sp.]|nr:MAG: hypothetical protein KIT25_03755 [Enhydrobacter sp.]